MATDKFLKWTGTYKKRGEAPYFNGRNETGFINLIWTEIVCRG